MSAYLHFFRMLRYSEHHAGPVIGQLIIVPNMKVEGLKRNSGVAGSLILVCVGEVVNQVHVPVPLQYTVGT